MTESVILNGARTPFGRFGGAFKDVKAVELGAESIKGALSRSAIDPEQVDKVIMGMVLQGGAGQIPSRQAARLADLDWNVRSETINKVCASGLRSVTMADQIIRSGDADTIIAGGMESMSNAPYLMKNARWGQRMGDGALVDMMVHDGLTCAFQDVHMAVHGSNVAEEYGLSREEQDEWAYRSHQRSLAAIDSGVFAEEIVPVTVRHRKGDTLVEHDEAPRRDTTIDQLAKLKPIFLKTGTITAGNAPGVNDGAASMVVMSKQRAEANGYKPMATILGHAEIGLEAPYLAVSPAKAIETLLARKGMQVGDIDLFEINEAFAAVSLTSSKTLGLDPEKVNVNGGAVALGHPIGASGARILLTLMYALKRRGGGLGIAAICSGSAQGDAILIRVDG